MSESVKHIALLRGINVGGKNKVPMKDLVSLCVELGWGPVRTCLQTGNIVFTTDQRASSSEALLEGAIESQFGFAIPVICRTASQFANVLEECPLSESVAKDPSRVILYLSKRPILKSVLSDLRPLAQANEQVCFNTQALWIHFPNGVGRSKLTPKAIDRAVGSAATGRNWRTALKIGELASGGL